MEMELHKEFHQDLYKQNILLEKELLEQLYCKYVDNMALF